MTLYRLESRRNLFDTTVSSSADLTYPKASGGDWPITAVDYNLLEALNGACNRRTFLASGDLDLRARDAALAAITTTLTELGESTTGWDVLVNSSQPSGGQWDDESLQRWIHLTKIDDSVEGITAAPYANATNPPVITWRVVFIQVVEVTT